MSKRYHRLPPRACHSYVPASFQRESVLPEILITACAAFAAALFIGWLLWGRTLADARTQATALANERESLREQISEEKQTRARNATEVLTLQNRVTELQAVEAERNRLSSDLSALKATLDERQAAFEAELARTTERFEALANKALEGAQTKFLARAEQRFTEQATTSKASLQQLLQPVAETLKKYETRLGEVEAVRAESYGQLKQQLEQVTLGQKMVTDEASRIVSALRSSGKTAGSWGEQQLQNTLDMAGLRAGIDYTLQAHVEGEGGSKRPDAIINLPGGRQLIIDSKCSLLDYDNATNAATDDERRTSLKRHAAAVRVHARGLSEKAYWKEFGAAADFVVMFIPGENFLSAAMEHDLPLLSWAFEQRILLAGPINLLAIAKTVALVWRQETLAEQSREIGKLGGELHAAIATMAEHLAGVGRNLTQAVGGYNDFVGSLERNVLPKARRFTEMGIEQGRKPVPTLGIVEAPVRLTTARELLAAPENPPAEANR